MPRRALLVVVLAACGGPRNAPLPPGPPQHPRPPACISYDAARDQEHAIDERNHAAYLRALAEQGMREPDFAADYYQVTDGTTGEWAVLDATEGRTLLAPTTGVSCGVSNPWLLAQEGNGKLHVAIVAPREVPSHPLVICGCQADVPITCGGAAPMPVRWRWRLPGAATWDGPLSVVVDHESVTTEFAGRPDGAPCPEPTAPP